MGTIKPELARQPNPVVYRVELTIHRGWTLRKYADGCWDGAHTLGLTPVFDTWQEAIAHIARETRRVDDSYRWAEHEQWRRDWEDYVARSCEGRRPEREAAVA
jgi:hypothetical protein